MWMFFLWQNFSSKKAQKIHKLRWAFELVNCINADFLSWLGNVIKVFEGVVILMILINLLDLFDVRFWMLWMSAFECGLMAKICRNFKVH